MPKPFYNTQPSQEEMAKTLKVEKGVRSASIFKRLVAFLVDLAILNFIVVWPFKRFFESMIPSGNLMELASFVKANPAIVSQVNSIYLFMGIMFFIYFTICEARFGQSLGKYIVGIYVKGEKENATFWQIVIRNIFLIPIFPILLLWVIDPLSLVFTKSRFSDRISKTQVIENVKKVYV